MRTTKKHSRHPGGRPRHCPLSPLGETIDRIATRRRMSRVDLAEAASLSYPSLHCLMTGKTSQPRATTIARIADALGVPAATLLAPLR